MGQTTLRCRLRRRGPLLAICAVTAVVETVLVDVFAPTASLGLATQVSSPPPFGIFHDLRWIIVYHSSWLGFAGELLAFLVLRSTLTALCLRAAWPRDVALEPWSLTMRRSVVFTVVASILLAPWAVLMFALAVVSLSWLFFVAVPAVLLTALLVHGGAVTGTWWYRTLSARSLGWVVVAFGVATLSASVLTTCPPWARVPVAAVAGLVNAWLWVRIADAVLCRRAVPRRVVPIAPVGIAAVFALVLVGTAAGFGLARAPITALATSSATSWLPSTRSSTVGGIALTAVTPLFVVSGFNTGWDGVPRQQVRLDLPQRRFSYNGLSGAAALPYRPDDTHRSFVDLAREFARQVDAYHRETGRRLTVVAESEGALIAKAYLAATPDAPVDNFVLLSPLLAPGRVYYPDNGAEGWGSAGGLALDGVAWALGGLSPFEVRADAPFFRSIVDEAPALRGLMDCHIRHVREFAILPLDTGVTVPPSSLRLPHIVVPGFHGGLLGHEATAEVVARVVAGRAIPERSGWSIAESVLQAGASAWQVPTLTTSVNLAWHGAPDPSDCRAIRHHLRARLHTSVLAP